LKDVTPVSAFCRWNNLCLWPDLIRKDPHHGGKSEGHFDASLGFVLEPKRLF
jgi:hypothetical protein